MVGSRPAEVGSLAYHRLAVAVRGSLEHLPAVVLGSLGQRLAEVGCLGQRLAEVESLGQRPAEVGCPGLLQACS